MMNKALKMTYHPQHHLEERRCILRTADQHHGAKLINSDNIETTLMFVRAFKLTKFQSEI